MIDQDTLDRQTTDTDNSGTLDTAQQVGTVTYGLMPEQIRQFFADNPTGEFAIVRLERQSDEPTIWSTGDQDLTRSLLKRGFDTVDDAS
jgi:hypothetical protein